MSEDLPDSVVLMPTGAILCLVNEIQRMKLQVSLMETKIAEIVARQEDDCYRLAKEIAYDRRRLVKLEAPADPTPSQKDRSEILRALLAANNGKMPLKAARQKMHLSKAQFSQLLASMHGGIEQKSYHLDKRQKILILK
jgi:hypothetical protein